MKVALDVEVEDQVVILKSFQVERANMTLDQEVYWKGVAVAGHC